MNIGIFDVVNVGILAVVVGAAMLIAVVRYDLAPPGRLATGAQWLLGASLGAGILAFTVKLAIIVGVLSFPELIIEPLISRDETPQPQTSGVPLERVSGSPRYVWHELPERKNEAIAAKDYSSPGHYVWSALPTEAPAPANNPTTTEKVALGERLFFDKTLSRDGTISCSSCHDVKGGSGSDGRATSLGIDHQIGTRNAPTVWNAAFQAVQFWDGRAVSLEEQAKGPLVNPLEMGMVSLAAVEEKVAGNASYREEFRNTFGDDRITIDRIAEAIAAYERTLITPDTPYDRFVRGELNALSPAQLRGMGLFQSQGCVNCHSGPNFSAASIFDGKSPLRIFPIYPTPYETRYELIQDSGASPKGTMPGAWRVPSLRNVALTAPYFHNGSVNDLTEAVRIMASVQLGRTGRYLVWSHQTKLLNEFDKPKVSDREISDLVAFLHALTSDSLAAAVERDNRSRNRVRIALGT